MQVYEVSLRLPASVPGCVQHIGYYTDLSLAKDVATVAQEKIRDTLIEPIQTVIEQKDLTPREVQWALIDQHYDPNLVRRVECQVELVREHAWRTCPSELYRHPLIAPPPSGSPSTSLLMA